MSAASKACQQLCEQQVKHVSSKDEAASLLEEEEDRSLAESGIRYRTLGIRYRILGIRRSSVPARGGGGPLAS
jgi:hypothetical protein